MIAKFCERGHLVSVIKTSTSSCPFCGSENLKETNWIDTTDVSVDPIYWEIYNVILDDGVEFKDTIPIYDVSELFSGRCLSEGT